MELYELNYLNLRRLIPEMEILGEQAVSIMPDGMDLHFNLIEKCKYTKTFFLSYCFQESAQDYWAPDLQIRLYSDARVAEVISGVLHRHYLHRNGSRGYRFCQDPSLNTLANRWSLNRFLYKWLRFCLKQGHSFKPVYSTEHMQQSLAQIFSNRL